MEILKLMQMRHSVRQYRDKPIEQEKRAVLDDLILRINADADLHIQIIYDEPKCFNSFMAHYGKFVGVKNYVVLVGKKSPDLDEKLGYYGEKLVLSAQAMGLNTCWVALTHGKTAATVLKGEKQGCVIAIGYGVTQGTPHKSKPICSVCNCSDDMPTWFADGIAAALLAPTAVNQQKFFFELLPDGSVNAKTKKGFYTKTDLGIARYHFEAVSGKKTDGGFVAL